jgi:hypothetical protein
LLLYPFDILQDLIVPEPQDSVALGFEIPGPLCVSEAFSMLTAIDLNHQVLFHAYEIDHVTPYWMLSTKFELGDLAHAHMTP